jgi:c-di-GMP-binding flagellar brake protein YcgR
VVDRRKYPRVNTTNLISHVTIDEMGRWIFQGMSRALDISRGGILLETAQPITPGCLSMMTVDMDNNLIEIKGELIHCSKSGPSTYHSGIKFISTDELITKFVTQMIKVYNHRKNNVLIAWSNNRLKESTASG